MRKTILAPAAVAVPILSAVMAQAAESIPVITPLPVQLPTDGTSTDAVPMVEIVPLAEAEPLPEGMLVITPVPVRPPEPLPFPETVVASSMKAPETESLPPAQPPLEEVQADSNLSAATIADEDVAPSQIAEPQVTQEPPPASTPMEVPIPIHRIGVQPRLRNAIISEEPSISAAPI